MQMKVIVKVGGRQRIDLRTPVYFIYIRESIDCIATIAQTPYSLQKNFPDLNELLHQNTPFLANSRKSGPLLGQTHLVTRAQSRHKTAKIIGKSRL